MKHHELIQLRKQRVLVFTGYTPDGFEIYKKEQARPDIPQPDNIVYKFSSKKQNIPFRIKKKNKTKKVKYTRPKDQPKNIRPKRNPFDTKRSVYWRTYRFGKKPREPYCTGCGVTFMAKHFLLEHHKRDKCGGVYLPPEQRAFVNKLRKERETQERWARHIKTFKPKVVIDQAARKIRRAEKVKRREAYFEKRYGYTYDRATG